MIEVNIGSPKDIKVTCYAQSYFSIYNKDYCVCNFYTLEKNYVLVIDLGELSWGYIDVNDHIFIVNDRSEKLLHTLENLIIAFKRFNIQIEMINE